MIFKEEAGMRAVLENCLHARDVIHGHGLGNPVKILLYENVDIENRLALNSGLLHDLIVVGNHELHNSGVDQTCVLHFCDNRAYFVFGKCGLVASRAGKGADDIGDGHDPFSGA